MIEIVNCGWMERFQIVWKIIKQTYYRQQLHKTQKRIAHNHEKASQLYAQRIDDVTKQFL
jgi:hypothetical protein